MAPTLTHCVSFAVPPVPSQAPLRGARGTQETRQIFSMLVPPGEPMGSPQVMT